MTGNGLVKLMGDSFLVSKEVLPSIEGFGFVETLLGDPEGCLRQYRNANGLHVREYGNYFEIHEDKVDPRVDPFGHLIRDSPETLVAFGAASILTRSARHKRGSISFGGPFSFLLIFLSLNNILRKLKWLLF
ncbi:MAG TPA: hypothetical protein VN739_05725 [Nitrososphaerales archaeon]|nr:hypothetical protein [Nitrososphaerales archaeon]